MSGFIYIWMDKKHKRYYVGSHWGSEDDGYICSSTWMMQAYKVRPNDFKRRILERYAERKLGNEIEHKWLQMMKPEELKGPRYYNMNNYRFGHWSVNESSRLSASEKMKANHWTKSKDADLIKEKISGAGRGRPNPSASRPKSEEEKRKISVTLSGRILSEEHASNIGKAVRDDYASGKRNNDSNIGSKRSEETKAKMREAQRALYSGPRGEEIKKKISEKKRTRDLERSL